MTTLQGYAELSHWTAQEKGFYDNEFTIETALSKLALVHSEVSEVLEAIRKDMGSDKIGEEVADVFIRLVDLFAALQENGYIDPSRPLDFFVSDKMATNSGRERLHGNLA